MEQETEMTMKRGQGFAPGPVLICLPLLILYMITALPAFGWRDNPEFASTTQTLGINHPAGFPLFSLVTKVITFLPLGSIPFRITVSVALLAAAALYMLYELIRRAAPLEDGRNGQARSWAAAGAVLTFGLTSTLWYNATEVEVYTFNLLLLGGAVYCALCWSSGRGEAWLYAGGLVYGLAAGNHGSVAFYAPAFMAYFFLHSRRDTGRRFLLLLFFFLVGFSVYLYLPVRAAANPPLDFGHPDTLERFISHVSDRKDAQSHFSGVRESRHFYRHAWIFLSETTPRAFWPIGLPLLVVGLLLVIRSNRPLALALVWTGLFDILFFIRWTSQPVAFLPAYYFTALLAGVSLAWLLAGPAARAGRLTLTSGLILIFALGVWLNFPRLDRSKTFLPLESFRTDYENLAPDAISLTGIQWFHQRAFQDVYRLREDVTSINIGDFLTPHIYSPVKPARFPRVAVPEGDPFYKIEDGEFLKRFLEANLDQGRHIYWEPFDFKGGMFIRNLRPELDLMFKFTFKPIGKLPPETARAALGRLRAKLEREIKFEGFLEAKEQDAYYIIMLFQYAFYFSRHGLPDVGLACLGLLEDLYGPKGMDRMTPGDLASMNINMGTLLLLQSRYEEAAGRFEAAAGWGENNYHLWFRLGLAWFESGRLEKARQALELAARLAPRAADPLIYLGRCYNRLGDPETARQYYRRALALTKDPGVKKEIEKNLGQLGG